MKTFIINAAKNTVTSFKKHEVSGKLMGREWRMLTDDPTITGKYIYLKDGKLILSMNGLSTYSTWQIATESTLIMDEGIATFLYKVVHIDENLIVLNLDGTNKYCFLINDASQSLANASLEDLQVHIYKKTGIDMLSPHMRQIIDDRRKREEAEKLAEERETIHQWLDVEPSSTIQSDKFVYYTTLIVFISLMLIAFIIGLTA